MIAISPPRNLEHICEQMKLDPEEIRIVPEFKKVKLDSGIFLMAEFTEQIVLGDTSFYNTIAATYTYLVHPDLLTALRRFIPHLLAITDYIDDDRFPVISHALLVGGVYVDTETGEVVELTQREKNLVKQFKVTGVSFGGSDENAGVTIIGQKEVRGKKVLNLVSPFVKYQDEHFPYTYSALLWEAAAELEAEARRYIYEGKISIEAGVQQELF